MANLIPDIFSTIGQAITGFATCLASGVTSVTSMFYTTGENGGLTVLGILALVAVGSGLVFFGFRLIMALIQRVRGR